MAVNDYQSLIDKYSVQYGVPVAWIKGIMMQESSGNPNAFRAEPRINDASYGLMQLLGRTARGLGWTGSDPRELYDPELNISLGVKYISQLRRSWGDDLRRVYSAYNSGKPDNYLTNPSVATNVNRVVNYVAQFLESEPLVVSAGGGGVLIIALLLWMWAKRTH